MKKVILATVTAAILSVSLPADEREGKIQQRKENQQARIAQGVKSGQLTAGETARLEKRESNVNKEIRADRAANDGKLTAAERQQINRQQNRMSKSIYKDKHNGAVQSR
jgi:hypothetical protein